MTWKNKYLSAVWGVLAVAALSLIPYASDPGLIKEPLMVMAAAVLVLASVKVDCVNAFDVLAVALLIRSLFFAHYHYDQWSVTNNILIALLFYVFGRWSERRLPAKMFYLFVWVVVVKSAYDLYFGKFWSISSFFVNRNIFAYLLIPILWYLAKLWRDGALRVKIFTTVTYMLEFSAFVATQSRGAFIGYSISIAVHGLVASFVEKRRLPLLKAALWMLAVCVVMLLALPSAWHNYGEIKRGVYGDSNSDSVEFHHKTSSEIRAWIWRSTIDSWRRNEFFGNGSGSAQYGMIKFQKPWTDDERDPFCSAWHSHSHYLEVLHDRGILGLSIEIILVVFSCVGWIRLGRNFLFGFAALMALILYDFVTEAAEYPTSIAVYWWLVGGGLRYFGDKKFIWHPGRVPRRMFVAALFVSALAGAASAFRPIMSDFCTGLASYSNAEKKKNEFYVQALLWWPDNPTAVYAIAMRQAQMQRFQMALVSLHHIDSVAPGLMYTPILRSQIYLAQGEFVMAEKESSDGILQYPYNESLNNVLLESLRLQGRCCEFLVKRNAVLATIRERFGQRLIRDESQLFQSQRLPLRLRIALPVWASDHAFQGYVTNSEFEIKKERQEYQRRVTELMLAHCP